jgi:hypothetical protein
MRKIKNRWLIKTAGHDASNKLWVEGLFGGFCGKVKDAITFRNGDEGVWVVDSNDILKLAELIKKEKGLK